MQALYDGFALVVCVCVELTSMKGGRCVPLFVLFSFQYTEKQDSLVFDWSKRLFVYDICK